MNSIVKLITITLSRYFYSLNMLLQPLPMILRRKKLSSSNSTKDQSVFTVGQDVNRQNMVKNYVNKDIFYKILKDYSGTATLVFYILISPIIKSYIFTRTVAERIPATFSISSYKLMINFASLPSQYFRIYSTPSSKLKPSEKK